MLGQRITVMKNLVGEGHLEGVINNARNVDEPCRSSRVAGPSTLSEEDLSLVHAEHPLFH